jgi:hypothetical protein
MSFIYATTLIIGVRLDENFMPNEIDLTEDKWLPYIKGSEDLEFRIYRDNSGSTDCSYIGKELAYWSEDCVEDNYFADHSSDQLTEDFAKVNLFLDSIGISDRASLIFFVDIA